MTTDGGTTVDALLASIDDVLGPDDGAGLPEPWEIRYSPADAMGWTAERPSKGPAATTRARDYWDAVRAEMLLEYMSGALQRGSS